MKRNMEITAEKAKGIVPERYDLTVPEIVALANKAKESKVDAVCTAFLYGFMMGHRATAAGKIDKRY